MVVSRTEYKPIVLVGPSGVGKSTLLKRLFAEFPDKFGFSVSHTTRPTRLGETHGREYYFVTKDEMEAGIAKAKFIEHATFAGNIYGTSFYAVELVFKQGRTAILDIDIQGVMTIQSLRAQGKTTLQPLYIFLAPPSMDILISRLKGRSTDGEDEVNKRIEAAHREIAWGRKTNEEQGPGVVIVSDDLDISYAELKKAIFDYLGA